MLCGIQIYNSLLTLPGAKGVITAQTLSCDTHASDDRNTIYERLYNVLYNYNKVQVQCIGVRCVCMHC